MASECLKQFTIENDIPVALLGCENAFKLLTSKERLYAHFLSRASWYGGLICLFQTSLESPAIYILFTKLFEKHPPKSFKSFAADLGLSKHDIESIIVYFSSFLANFGNYKGFGDTKFIPDISREKLTLVFEKSGILDEPSIRSLWLATKDKLFTLENNEKSLGFPPSGVTTYFSSNCTSADGIEIQKFLDAQKLSAYNTRLIKESIESGYIVKLASVLQNDESEVVKPFNENFLSEEHSLPNSKPPLKVKVRRGDYSSLLALVVKNLQNAIDYASNETEMEMLKSYIECFRTGSIEAHKRGSQSWIKDVGPTVESYIGFIESYRDPHGSRGEFEGFVSMVDRDRSTIFGNLVKSAEEFIPRLPWPSTYEKDKFLKPDFTSLDVLCFAGSGVPAGINIPNYNDIRQNEGFKNVSLGNVLKASYSVSRVQFLNEKDAKMMQDLKVEAFEVTVGLHELLGHGSGKLFIKNHDGSFNFDHDKTKHLLTDEPITSYYAENETYESRFTRLSSTFEECRAESVALHLSLYPDILEIFRYTDPEAAGNIKYTMWLSMVLSGVKGLEFYFPDNKAWGQAHCQARFVITNVLMEKPGLVEIERTTGSDDKPDVLITLRKDLIDTHGKEAVSSFLQKLQLYKSTGDYENARKMYDEYSNVTQFWLEIRQIIVERKLPRPILVQCNTFLTDDGTDVVLREYEASTTGVIESFIERFQDDDDDASKSLMDVLYELWEENRKEFG